VTIRMTSGDKTDMTTAKDDGTLCRLGIAEKQLTLVIYNLVY